MLFDVANKRNWTLPGVDTSPSLNGIVRRSFIYAGAVSAEHASSEFHSAGLRWPDPLIVDRALDP